VNCDGGALIQAETQEIGVELDNGGEVVLAAAHVDVLIDGDVGEEAKAYLVAGSHHDGVVVGVGGFYARGVTLCMPLKVERKLYSAYLLVMLTAVR
jgi:hypothetical protein